MVYHCSGCPCGQPEGPMTIGEFLRYCFYELERGGQHNTIPTINRRIGSVPSDVRQNRRRDFIGRFAHWDDGTPTRINDDEQRYPILCDYGEQAWDPADRSDTRKCPSSMTFQSGLSKRRLLDAIENGTSIGAPFFQHHRYEKPVCSCEATIRPPNPDRQRDVLDDRCVDFSVLLIKDQNGNLTFRKKIPAIDNNPPRIESLEQDEYPDHEDPTLFIKSQGDDLRRGQFKEVNPNRAGGAGRQKISLGNSGTGLFLLPLSEAEFTAGDLPERHSDLLGRIDVTPELSLTTGEVDEVDWDPNISLWPFPTYGVCFPFSWNTPEERDLLRNFIKHYTGIALRDQFDHNRVRINLFNQNNEQVTESELNNEPQLINDCKLRITRHGGRVLKSFTIKFSSGLNFSQNSLRSMSRSGIFVEDISREGEPNKFYKIRTYDAKTILAKSMIELQVEQADEVSGWIEVCCYENRDPVAAGDHIQWG